MWSACRSVAKMGLAVGLVATMVDGAPKSATGNQRTESLLMIKCDGDSVDFRLLDPLGRVAVIAVDSSMCSIPGCSVEKRSDNTDQGDSSLDPDSIDLRPYGGGVFSLEDPAPGVWRVDALAARGCEDTCGVEVFMWSMGHVNQDGRCWLRPGGAARWRMTLEPIAQREGRVWARIELEKRTTIAKLRPPKP